MLAAGLAAALALAAAQYFFPVSRALWAGREVNLALLGERASSLLVYQPGPGAVKAYNFTHQKPRPAVTRGARAAALVALAGGTTAQAEIFYVAVSSAPDLDALWGALNGWKAEPVRFFSAAAWAGRLRASGASDLAAFDVFCLFSDFSKLSQADFSVADVSKQDRDPEPQEAGAAGPAPRVEVFNASGKKDLAALAAKRLRALGFDVITAVSYPRREKHTRILGFSRDTSAALRLRSALGLDALEVRVKTSQKSVAAAAVILGEDFEAAGLDR